MSQTKILHRNLPDDFIPGTICDHPILERVYVTRGIKAKHELEQDLKGLLPFQKLKDIDKAISRLYEALQKKQHILILGDFDADGATSSAIGMKALKAMGATQVSYLVPNRFEFGYGLTPEIVAVANERKPDLIVTVDNGISSFEGTDAANDLGIDVIITDHHIQADHLPNACAVVNPNRHDDEFESKNLAGCGVIFYIMLALRAHLRKVGWFESQDIPEPNMAQYLDLVALGTVADLVPLDRNNRILVHQGLKRIRSNQCRPGISSLLAIGKRNQISAATSDLGFAVAPRLNAAGRLEDISIGIECLLADDKQKANNFAVKLDHLNQDRKVIEDDMKRQVFSEFNKIKLSKKDKAFCLYDSSWHQGVIGILAARIKEKYYRPTVILADCDEGMLKGSGRSVAGFHLRDCFDRIATKNPGVIDKFGGHAMAAGLTMKKENLLKFRDAFLDDVANEIDENSLLQQLMCDGELTSDCFNVKFAEVLREGGPWGQLFPEPQFANKFRLIEQRIVGAKHLKLSLGFEDRTLNGIMFNVDLNRWPNHRCKAVYAAYKLDVNEYNGFTSVQLLVDCLQAITSG